MTKGRVYQPFLWELIYAGFILDGKIQRYRSRSWMNNSYVDNAIFSTI